MNMDPKTTTILTIGSDPATLAIIETCLARRGHAGRTARSGSEGLRLLREANAELVLLALPAQDISGRALIAQIRAHDPLTNILITGTDASIPGAPDALELGAVDYLADPVSDTSELLSILGVALGARRSDTQLRFLRRADAQPAVQQALLGDCPAMQRVRATVLQVCRRTATGATPMILIIGETGTGKGLLAKHIHYNSARRNRAFVDLNCAAIPASLLEGELFGHERGAFTDAGSARAGLLEAADGGTLFLDEIGNMPLDLQAKLLTSIEEKRVRRLGTHVSRQIDVQIIAATHNDLEAKVGRGEFREDLFHRLNVVAIELPALRNREGDRLALAQAFIRAMCQQYGLEERRLDAAAATALLAYAWPGNVRELRNRIERILLLDNDVVIGAHHFQFGDAHAVRVQGEAEAPRVELPSGGVSFAALEREILRQALERCQSNVSLAARFLHLSRQTLIYRLKKYQLGSPD